MAHSACSHTGPRAAVKALIHRARIALVADRDGLSTSCQDVREELAVARGGELRRGPLRRHLKLCTGCRDFQFAVSEQRESLAVVLPVVSSTWPDGRPPRLRRSAHGSANSAAGWRGSWNRRRFELRLNSYPD